MNFGKGRKDVYKRQEAAFTAAKEPDAAAICSEEAAASAGLEILERGVQNTDVYKRQLVY